jgi:TPR repeat protein
MSQVPTGYYHGWCRNREYPNQHALVAAEQGDYLAQYNLALAYANGRGVSIDPIEALRWYRPAAASLAGE